MKIVRTLLSFLVAIALIWFVIAKSGVDLQDVWHKMDGRTTLFAFALFGIGFFVASYRWYYLLHYIEVRLSVAVVLRLALIGQFFNLVVPGGVGGDLIKMVYLRKEAGNRVPEAVLTVLLDRLIGLAGLLLLGLIGVALNPSLMMDSAPPMRTILAVVALGGGVGLVGAVLFALWPYLHRFAGPLGKLKDRLPAAAQGIVGRVLEAMALLRSSPLVVFKLLVLAMLGHLFATFSVCALGWGVEGVASVSFQEYLLATQLANLVAAVPLTPGGLGGRDLTLSYLLKQSGAVGVSIGVIPLVLTSIIILWSAIGGFALLWEKKNLHATLDEPEEE